MAEISGRNFIGDGLGAYDGFASQDRGRHMNLEGSLYESAVHATLGISIGDTSGTKCIKRGQYAYSNRNRWVARHRSCHSGGTNAAVGEAGMVAALDVCANSTIENFFETVRESMGAPDIPLNAGVLW